MNEEDYGDYDPNNTGYNAIAGPRPVTMPTGPTATRRLKRMPNGLVTTVFVDASGVEINPDGYNILDSGPEADLNQLGLNPLKDEEKTVAEEIKDELPRRERSDNSYDNSISNGASRSPVNNFGYVDKPGWMGVTSFAPGPIGLAAKAVNLGINANNSVAVTKARDLMDVPDMKGIEKTKSFISDRRGQVADVNIGDKRYSVGFEALSPEGNTNLTPNEARARGLQAGNISLADSVRKSTESTKEDRGLLSGFFSEARSFLDNIFSTDTNTKTKDTDKIDINSFPEAPRSPDSYGRSNKGEAAYDGKSYSGQNAGDDSPSERSGIGRGSPMGGGKTGGSGSFGSGGGLY